MLPTIDFSKFTSNKNILNRVVVIGYNQVCGLILSFRHYIMEYFRKDKVCLHLSKTKLTRLHILKITKFESHVLYALNT